MNPLWKIQTIMVPCLIRLSIRQQVTWLPSITNTSVVFLISLIQFRIWKPGRTRWEPEGRKTVREMRPHFETQLHFNCASITHSCEGDQCQFCYAVADFVSHSDDYRSNWTLVTPKPLLSVRVYTSHFEAEQTHLRPGRRWSPLFIDKSIN